MISDINLEKFPFGVNILGSLRSEKGLGRAVRSDVYSLKAVNIPIALNDSADSSAVNTGKLDEPLSESNPFIFNLIHINPNTNATFNASDVNFYEYLSDYTNYMNGHYNIGYWIWELDRIPEHWINLSNRLDEVWTASDFSFQSLSRDLSVPVFKIPHSIVLSENSFDKVVSRRDLNLSNDIYVFLFIFDSGSYIERKNPLAVVKSFKKAFSPADKALLYIKTAHTDFNKQKFYELVNAVRGHNIIVSDSVLTDDQTYSLISLSDCYVSLHKSEGFGLTLAEAMALGKPVIATGYSGNMDFMNKGNSFPVDYRLVKISEDYGVYKKGNVWAEPDVNHAAELMRHVFENREEAKGVGEKGGEYIKSFYGSAFVGEIYKKRLNDIMGRFER